MGTIARLHAEDAGGNVVEAVAADAALTLWDLDRRWSRFDAGSEVSRLNAAAGRAMTVSSPTLLLVELARQGWAITDGAFDPTILGDVARAGYDRSFEMITDESANAASSRFRR